MSPLCHFTVNTRLDAGKTVEELLTSLDSSDPTMQRMTEADKQIERPILRAVFGLMAYLNTVSPDVQPVRFHDRPRLGIIPPITKLVGGSFTRCPPGWHLRRAHMRWLKHERFKRDEAGNIKVVWVQGTEVNKNLDPAAQRKFGEVDGQETE